MPATPKTIEISRADIVREELGKPFDSGDGLPDIWTIDQLRLRPKPNWLIRHVVEEKGLTVLFGPDKVGKTALLSNFLWAWVGGHDYFFNESFAMADPIEGDRKVLYVLLEGQATFYQRYQAWREVYDDPEGLMDNFLVIDEGLALFDQRMKWDDPKSWSTSAKNLWNAVVKHRPQILVVDTLSRSTAGMDENSPQMANVIGFLDHMRDAMGIATILVHHVALDSGGRPRGHSSLKGAASSYVLVTGQPDGDFQKLVTGPHRNAATYNPKVGREYGWQFHRKEAGDAFVVEPHAGATKVYKLDQLEELVMNEPGIPAKVAGCRLFGEEKEAWKSVYGYVKRSVLIEKDEDGKLYPVEAEEVGDI